MHNTLYFFQYTVSEETAIFEERVAIFAVKTFYSVCSKIYKGHSIKTEKYSLRSGNTTKPKETVQIFF